MQAGIDYNFLAAVLLATGCEIEQLRLRVMLNFYRLHASYVHDH